jgi:hypothetical protein
MVKKKKWQRESFSPLTSRSLWCLRTITLKVQPKTIQVIEVLCIVFGATYKKKTLTIDWLLFCDDLLDTNGHQTHLHSMNVTLVFVFFHALCFTLLYKQFDETIVSRGRGSLYLKAVYPCKTLYTCSISLKVFAKVLTM